MRYLVYATEKRINKEKIIAEYTRGHIAISLALTFASRSDIWENVRVELKENNEQP